MTLKILTALLLLATPGTLHAAVPQYEAEIVATYPHDPRAFTEGLFYRNGFLYESTGTVGRSSIRKVELTTGKVLQERRLGPPYFGEGIAPWKDRLYELTWRSHVGFTYNLQTLKPLSRFHIDGEGWALTEDSTHLFMSDGTSNLRRLNPETLAETGRIHVTCDGSPVSNINELEWIKGQIYANIWMTSLIVRIDPRTGNVTGAIHLDRLVALNPADPADKVANGIAYDAEGDRLFVTGKLWPHLYQISLAPAAAPTDICRIIR